MNISKFDLLKSLKRIKLVIGNGFDLHCGLKTRYKDYFESGANKEKFEYIKKWMDDYRNFCCANENNNQQFFTYYEKFKNIY